MAVGLTVISVNPSVSGTLTTTAPIPVGNLVVVGASSLGSGGTITSVSDATANVYKAAIIASGATGCPGISIFYCYTRTTLPTGTVYTAVSTLTAPLIQTVMAITGINAPSVDQTASVTSSVTSTSVNLGLTMATGALIQPTEAVIAITRINVSWTGYTQSTGFTSALATSGVAFDTSVATTTAVTYAPTWTTGQGYTSAMASFSNMQTIPRRNIVRITKRVF